jgi:hypothetical protein
MTGEILGVAVRISARDERWTATVFDPLDIRHAVNDVFEVDECRAAGDRTGHALDSECQRADHRCEVPEGGGSARPQVAWGCEPRTKSSDPPSVIVFQGIQHRSCGSRFSRADWM